MTEPMTTRQRIRENAPDDLLLPNPKKGKKAVSTPMVTPALVPPEEPELPVFAMPAILPVVPPLPEQLIEDNAKSNTTAKTNSSAKSATSSAKIRQLEAKRQAILRLQEIDKELLQKERETILPELNINNVIAAAEDDNQDFHIPDEQLVSPVAPYADRNSSIAHWIQNEPLTQAEHPYAVPSELDLMNNRIEKLLARQTISKDLPNFSGDPAEWFGFIYQFEHTTALCGLTNQENMVRLNKCLSSKAREAVAPLLCLPENVPMVISTLKMLFGRPNQIIKSLIGKTRNLPAIDEAEPESIIAFANAVNNLVATMSSLKQEGHMNNPGLMEELLRKLPASLQLNWCMSKPEDTENLQAFATWMMRVATAATSMPTPSFSANEKSTHDFRQSHRQMLNSNDSRPKNPNLKCLRCNTDGHSVTKCSQFLSDTIENRWNLVAAKKLCFSCLRTGHQTANCTTKRSCGINGCTMPHNTLLHRNEPSPPAQTHFCGTSREVLLRVIPVQLTGPNDTIKTYALLDDGSTVTMLDKTVLASQVLRKVYTCSGRTK